ncbi:MAG: class I SAM-dependent methyltransferase [Bacteroidota bacterium]
MDAVAKGIIDNYKSFDEDSRLRSAYGIIEEEHTRKLIAKHLASQPLDVYDVGGGTGHYSLWLASLAHRVYFSDIVPKHVDIFRNRSQNVASINIEDARALSYANDVADLVILNGPLYHLLERDDRLKALNEAKRILKPNGLLLAFSISRFAGLNYALSSGEIFNDDYFEMVKGEVASGVRDNRPGKNKTFVSAYFHLLEEVESEVKEAGLSVENSFGVGLMWSPPGIDEILTNPVKRLRLLQAVELIESNPMQGAKMLTVGRKIEHRITI